MKPQILLAALALTGVAFADTKDGTPSISSGPTPNGSVCQPIPDNLYRGNIFDPAQAICKTFSTGTGTVNNLALSLGLTHTWAGDLVIKVRNPAGSKTVTLVSRPGAAETDDLGAAGPGGDSSNLLNTAPIRFGDAFVPSAETMGSVPALSSAQTICIDLASPCDYKPDPGATIPAGALAAFDGDAAGAGWTVCVGDRGAADTGDFCSVAVVGGPVGGSVIAAVTASGTPITLPGYGAGATPGTAVAAPLSFNVTGGGGSLNCTTTGTGYAVTPSPLALVVGTTGSVTVRYTGIAAGTFTGTLSCSATAPATGGPFTYNLSTTVSAGPAAVLIPTPTLSITGLMLLIAGVLGLSAFLFSRNRAG